MMPLKVTTWNVLVGCDPDRIVEVARRAQPNNSQLSYYGDGHTTECIILYLIEA
jgi:hypothetical protein